MKLECTVDELGACGLISGNVFLPDAGTKREAIRSECSVLGDSIHDCKSAILLQLVHLEISLFFRAVRAPQVDMFAQASLYAWAARA